VEAVSFSRGAASILLPGKNCHCIYSQDQEKGGEVSKKRKAKLTSKQAKLIKNLAAGMNQTDAAREAGYSPNRPGQSGYQAIKQLQQRMPELLDELGLIDHAIIEKHLIPLLKATETKFFPYRRQVERKKERPVGERQAKEKIEKDRVVQTVQVIDEREVAALGIRIAALDILCKLKGIYAPKQIEFDPAAPVPVVTVDMRAIQKRRERD
jgi:hypothetical protein